MDREREKESCGFVPKMGEYRYSLTGKYGAGIHEDKKVGDMHYGSGTQETSGGRHGTDAMITVRFDSLEDLPRIQSKDIPELRAVLAELVLACKDVVKNHVTLGDYATADVQVEATPKKEGPSFGNPYNAMRTLLTGRKLSKKEYAIFKDLEREHGELNKIPEEDLVNFLIAHFGEKE